MNILRSFTETVVTTPTDLFPISFEYDEKYDAVHVFLNDVAVEDLGYTVSQVNAVTLKVEPAIPEGTVRIERETDIDKMRYIFDAGALFIDQNVDADFRQIVHSQQEVRDGFIKLRNDVLPLVDGLEEALEAASEAGKAAEEAAQAAEEAANIALTNLRSTVSTIANLESLPTDDLYVGKCVYVVDLGCMYIYNGSSWDLSPVAHVTPDMFNGDIIEAANFAASHNLELHTGDTVYEVGVEFKVPKGLTWVANHTVIKQVAPAIDSSSASVLAPESNVTIKGYLILDMGAPTTGWGEKCHFRMDSFNNITPQVSNVQFDTLELRGGYFNCNGVVMAGGAKGLRGSCIKVGDSANIGRVFMAHWGNFTQHSYNRTTLKYTHVPNYSPTTHPNDCVIDSIYTGDLTCNTNDFSAIALISAGYNIHIGRIEGNVLDSTISGKGHYVATAGDLAFAYATPLERKRGMWGLTVDSIFGTTYSSAVCLISEALYRGADDLTNVVVPPTAADYDASIKLTIGDVDVTGRTAAVGNNYAVIARTGQFGKVKIESITTREFYSTFRIVDLCYNLEVGVMNCYDSKINPVTITGTTTLTRAPRGVHISTLNVWRYGVTSSSTTYRSVIQGDNFIDIVVDTLNVYEHGNAYCVVDIGGIITPPTTHIGEINVYDSTYPNTFLINNRSTMPIRLNSVYSTKPLVQVVSGGVVQTLLGKHIRYVSASVPTLSLNVGDEVLTNNGLLRCIAAGPASTTNLQLVEGGVDFAQDTIVLNPNTRHLLTSGRKLSYCKLALTSLRAAYSVSVDPTITFDVVMTADDTFSVYATNHNINTPYTLPSGRIYVQV
ncbi:hypothetical protein vBAbaPPDAB9_7 [Acinetobacter phage vB_AbaP_PD-AB9]|uniref:Tailspike protein n=1 Tax=Acinetobacter phage vB_AbaP_PD-AB9 TaxID=1701808 RepID=A0A0S1RZY5_9CAUD|nr:tail fiber protein [Acinetobacter phage vB_AbaP_PD-AB9]ALM01895.1 hypothetical protein vBAbaPPDAB9_7 [Acinetobacter phage vB_AbaP_PD-AB9]